MRRAALVVPAGVLLVSMSAIAAGNGLYGEWDMEVPGWATSSRESRPRLALDAPREADGTMRLAFKAACNSYGGKAVVEGERIDFDVEAGTLMDCLPALRDRDRAFVRRLEAVTSFEMSRVPEVPFTRVTLKGKDGTTLLILRAGR